MKRVLALAATILLALVVLAVQPTSSVITVHLDVDPIDNGGMAEVRYSVDASPHMYEMIISIMPVDGLGDLPDMLIVDVDGGPGRSPAVTGLYDHLTTDLRLRGIDPNVTIVDMERLDLKAISNSVLIIGEATDMEGDAAADIMSWVRDGGRLICIGPDSLPFHQEMEDGEWTGREDFLRVRYRYLNYSADEAEESIYAQALSLRTSAPLCALERSDLEELGAVTIGHTHHDVDGDLVTSAMVPLGTGRLVLFGGPLVQPAMVSGDTAVSWDIMQLVTSGALWSTGPPEFILLPMGADARDGNFTTSISGDAVVIAYTPRPYVPVYGRTLVAAS